MVKIAVIDDGISKNRIEELEFNIEIDKDCRIIEYSDNVQDNNHGTICAMIIMKYAPEALVGSIKILQTYTERGYVAQFKIALDWCIQNDISLINLSLGSTQSYDSSILYECIENAYKNGIIIVAALSNKNVVTYPASFQNVIGVKTDPLLVDDMFYLKQNCIEGADVVASSKHNIENTITYACNSYAAPLITAKVNNIINQNGCRDIGQIKAALNSTSFKMIEGYDPYKSRNLITDIENKYAKQIEIPCIIIKYENVNDKIPYLVNKMFNQNGYNTLLILTDKYIAPENPSIVITESLNDNTLAYISSKYDANIIIIGLADTNNKTININCDIFFCQETQDDQLTDNLNDSGSKRSISYELKVSYESGNSSIEYIYQKTTELLT